MNVGLVDVDGHNYPNLALMKLSAWHKSQGDNVEWASMFNHYDVVYKSKVFTWTDDDIYSYDADFIDIGGTGYKDYTKVLPDKVEHICPDYSLYDIKDTAYGFTTRGCIRKCPFCLVSKKEGYIRDNADIEEFWGGQKNLILMDNNILASDHGIKQLEKCIKLGIRVDCNQGMDARIAYKSEYILHLLANLKLPGNVQLRFACDNKSEIEPCEKTIEGILAINPKAQFIIYCLLTDDYEDSYNRVMRWRKYGHKVAIYAPPYRNFDDPHQRIPDWQNKMAQWANRRWHYYSCTFEEFCKGKSPKQDETLF